MPPFFGECNAFFFFETSKMNRSNTFPILNQGFIWKVFHLRSPIYFIFFWSGLGIFGFLLFLLLCFSAFLLFRFFAFPASLLFLLLSFLLPCFFAFCLSRFSASLPFYFYFSFSAVMRFAPLLLCLLSLFTVSLLFCFFCFVLSCLYPK